MTRTNPMHPDSTHDEPGRGRPATPADPQFDPRHDFADAPARPSGDTGAPVGVQDQAGSRPIDRIERLQRLADAPRREPGRKGLAAAVIAFLIVAGIVIGTVVMQRPVPTMGFMAIAVGMLLLFAAPSLLAMTVEPEPRRTTEPRRQHARPADAG